MNMPPPTVIMTVLRIDNHGSQKIKPSFVVYNHGSEIFEGKKKSN
jgi:hypothetical protein